MEVSELMVHKSTLTQLQMTDKWLPLFTKNIQRVLAICTVVHYLRVHRAHVQEIPVGLLGTLLSTVHM